MLRTRVPAWCWRIGIWYYEMDTRRLLRKLEKMHRDAGQIR